VTRRAIVVVASLCLVSIAEAASMRLDVPVIRQSREHCGQAALAMVMLFYGADSSALREADRAYDPALRGSLITDLAAAARRAGFEAEVVTIDADSILALLEQGVPPIILYQNGPLPLTVKHYGVVAGWDPERASFIVNDGGKRPRTYRRDDLDKRWRTAGNQALIVRRRPR
jgi:ABC-type bacteriocin/lantibiotic exporter with double-glycine peptidase domain